MAAYSLDLRQRIVDALERGSDTKRNIAKIFNVHESFIYKLLRQKRDTGEIAPLPHGGGASPKLNDEHLHILADLVILHPDATLEERGLHVEEESTYRSQPQYDLPGAARTSALIKKKSKLAAEADPAQRAEFKEKQRALPAEDLIFIDEFGANTAMTRTHARAFIGKRGYVTEPFKRGPKHSVIAAMGMSGVCAPLMLEGAVDAQVFDLYVEKFLVPQLQPGKIILLDNVKFHYSEKAIGLIEAAGATVMHLPAYSPDFNPIEECISKIKGVLRSRKARTQRKLYNALKKALAMIRQEDIQGWFKHCGYLFSFN